MTTSPNLPTPELIPDDGAFWAALCNGLRPDRVLTVSEWADAHRHLDTKSASEAGRWSTSRTPYLREIMDCLSVSSPVTTIVFAKGAQVGGTEAGLNWVGYVIDHAPGPILMVAPTGDIAKMTSQTRLDPMIAGTPRLAEKIPPARQRDSGNTLYKKEFPGGMLRLVGANSAAALRSMPARFLFMDEVDAYPGNIEGEGDPVALAEARTRSFFRRRKVFLVSTPTITGQSRITAAYLATDQRRYFVACPHCRGKFWLKWEKLQWPKGEPDKAAYYCDECGAEIREHHKTWMMDPANGAEWRPTAKAPDAVTRGYHISSLYSPLGWYSWADAARDWEAAQGSDDAIRVFKNTVLGETFTQTGDAPDYQRLYERREAWKRATVPAGGLFLTAGADIQKDRIEVSVWTWGQGLQSWLVDHIVIDGGAESPAAWEELAAVLADTWTHESGAAMPIRRMALDTGNDTQAAYGWARKMASPLIMPIKGVGKYNAAAPVNGPTYVDTLENGRRIKRGARLWKVAVDTFKSETYRWLKLDRPEDAAIEASGYPAGYIHFPEGVDLEYFKQLTAEQLVVRKTKRGFQVFEWEKIRDRNEALDCRVYARAAAYSLGMDFWPPHRWAGLAAQVAGGDADPAPEPVAEPPASTGSDGFVPPVVKRLAGDVRRSAGRRTARMKY